ncbi:MAG TPA: flagellar hook basal-body protein [Planctomycetaceae bacterium]|jgi:flagellar basal-body rod protein FlgF|nr:flagellar hook basal-body protein [Planctomycetaceae bacterium]
MLYGLYLSAQGAQAQSTRLDVLSNNLANVGTAGFKRDLAIFQSNRPYDIENGGFSSAPGNQSALTGGVSPAKILTDYSEGPVVRTGGALDAALTGQGFFQVTDGKQQFLTRDGQFSVSATGDLMMQNSNMRVMSNVGNPISVPLESAKIELGSDGTISSVSDDGTRTQVAKMALVRPASNQQLEKVGKNLFRANGLVSPAGSDLKLEQGFVEQSGATPVGEMVAMVQASRLVEANVNMIKYQDEALDRLLQSAAPH